jgi:hypothetical protein
MSDAHNIPYTWTEIEDQVREAIIAMASILSHFGPHGDAVVKAFLGKRVEIPELGYMTAEEIAEIDITRHYLYKIARKSWCYAYQSDGWEDFGYEDWHEMSCGLLNGGYALNDCVGEPTGLDWRNEMPLRRVLETAAARWNWTHDDQDLTVRELALLSNMAESTVRSTLSKEGYKLGRGSSDDDDKVRHSLSSSEALQWLSRRRGFIPNATQPSPDRQRIAMQETLNDKSIPFSTAVKRMVQLAGIVAGDKTGVEADWFSGLIEGHCVKPDLDALIALADALNVSRPAFASRGIEHLLAISEAEDERESRE